MLGSLGKFFWFLFSFSCKKSVFDHLCARYLQAGCAYDPVFGRVEREEIYLQESESFVTEIVLLVFDYSQCLIRSGRRKYSPINV